MRPERWLLVGTVLLATACGQKEVRERSASPRVKMRTGQVWRTDLSRALELDADGFCKELGLYDCVDMAHRITMGGVEPERLGIDAPLEEPAVSAPMAFERAAISACSARFERDRSGSPLIFGPILADPTSEARAEVSTTLVRRILHREPTEEQVSGLVALYDTLAPLSRDPTADWAVGACALVATSIEALFY